jgi:hypothetical protein
MRYNQNSTRTKSRMTLPWLAAFLSFILTCLPTSALATPTWTLDPSRQAPSRYHLLPIADQEPSSPSLILVDQEKLKQFTEQYQRCVSFANVCQERVSLLEAYKADADAALEAANKDAGMARQDLDSEKTKNKFIYPGIALLLGLIAGHFLVK